MADIARNVLTWFGEEVVIADAGFKTDPEDASKDVSAAIELGIPNQADLTGDSRLPIASLYDSDGTLKWTARHSTQDVAGADYDYICRRDLHGL